VRAPTDESLEERADKVQALIDFYPGLLICDKVTEDSKSVWFSLEGCPFNDFEPHPGAAGGKGMSCIRAFEDGGITFNCFWDDCHDKKFTDVLKVCADKSGRPCPVKFWGDPDIDELAAAWGGVDDLAEEEISRRFESFAPSVHGLTYEDLREPFLAIAHHEYILLDRNPERQQRFKERMTGILRDRNLREMARYLGHEMVEHIREWRKFGEEAA
jgi:hypothetical protein